MKYIKKPTPNEMFISRSQYQNDLQKIDNFSKNRALKLDYERRVEKFDSIEPTISQPFFDAEENEKETDLFTLFSSFGTPKFVQQIVTGLELKLNADDLKYISNNFGVINEKIRTQNSSKTVNGFVDFIVKLVQYKTGKNKPIPNPNPAGPGPPNPTPNPIGALPSTPPKGINLFQFPPIQTTPSNLSKGKKKKRNDLLEQLKQLYDDGYTINTDYTLTDENGDNHNDDDLNDTVKQLKKNDKKMMDTAITDFRQAASQHQINMAAANTPVSSSSGRGFKNKIKKIQKKQKKTNYKVIRGSGAIETLDIHQDYSSPSRKLYYDLNKFVLDADDINKNICRLKYMHNSSTQLKPFKVSDPVKDMIIDVAKDTKFKMKNYMNLTEDDKIVFSDFCDKTHINIDLPSDHKKQENDYKILKGAHDAGNSQPILAYLFRQLYSGKLKKQDYLDAMQDLIENK